MENLSNSLSNIDEKVKVTHLSNIGDNSNAPNHKENGDNHDNKKNENKITSLKNNYLPIKDKLKVINFIEEGNSAYKASDIFNIQRTIINNWIKIKKN